MSIKNKILFVLITGTVGFVSCGLALAQTAANNVVPFNASPVGNTNQPVVNSAGAQPSNAPNIPSNTQNSPQAPADKLMPSTAAGSQAPQLPVGASAGQSGQVVNPSAVTQPSNSGVKNIQQVPGTNVTAPISGANTAPKSPTNTTVPMQPIMISPQMMKSNGGNIEINIPKSTVPTVNVPAAGTTTAGGAVQPTTSGSALPPIKGTVETAPANTTLPPVSLPSATKIEISPRGAQQFLINQKTANFNGIESVSTGTETIPTLSVQVQPMIVPTMPVQVMNDVCKNSANGGSVLNGRCINGAGGGIATAGGQVQVAPMPTSTVTVNLDKVKQETSIESAGVTAVTQESLKFENSTLTVATPNGDTTVNILPDVAAQVATANQSQKINKVELKITDNKPVYEVSGTKSAKLLWFIPVSVSTTTQVSAEDGTTLKTTTPWWNFLAK